MTTSPPAGGRGLRAVFTVAVESLEDPAYFDRPGFVVHTVSRIEGALESTDYIRTVTVTENEPAAVSVPQAAPDQTAEAIASCPGRELSPNPCRCPCYGCKHHCAAHDPSSVTEAPAALRERVAAALYAHDYPGRTLPVEGDDVGDAYRRWARSVMAALPGDGRAAVYRELADRQTQLAVADDLDRRRDLATARRQLVKELRRLADEATPVAGSETRANESAATVAIDRAAVYREVADRLAADAEQGAKDGFTRIYRRSAATQVREWAEELANDPSGALIDEYLQFLRGQGPEPDLSHLSPAQREAVAGQFEVVKALADRDRELPSLDRDPVARRLGLVEPDDREQGDLGETRRRERGMAQDIVIALGRKAVGVADASAGESGAADETGALGGPLLYGAAEIENRPDLNITPIAGDALNADEGVEDRLRCPRCSEDITGYGEDDFVFRTGDKRPYCSGECVVAAYRAARKEHLAAHPELIVGYKSKGGRLLRCLAHHPGQQLLDCGDFCPVTSDDLPDGGVCTFLISLDEPCGVNVLIPQRSTPATPDAAAEQNGEQP